VARGATIRVPEDYRDIQTAVNHALDGDIILVSSGSYNGFTVSKSVTIIGESNETVIIRGAVVVSASGVKLSNFRVVLDEVAGGSVAVLIKGVDVVLTNVVVESYKYGVQVGSADGRASAVIEYSTVRSDRETIFGYCSSLSLFYNTLVSESGNAVAYCGLMDVEYNKIISRGTGLTIGGALSEGNIAKENEVNVTGDAAGIFVDGRNHLVERNKLFNGGIDVRGSQSVIKANLVVAPGIGVNLVGNGNIVEGNIISAGGHAIDLYGSGNLILNNTLSGSRGVHGLNGRENIIAFNFINRTGNVGVYMSKYTNQNVIYGNTFWLCYNYDAADESGGNTWYNETIKMGNYWSNNKAPDLNGDGITDQPYHIATTTNLEIVDKYPLARPLISLEQPTTTPTISPSTSPTTALTTPSSTSTMPSTTPSSEGGFTNTVVASAIIALLGVAVTLLLLLRRSHK